MACFLIHITGQSSLMLGQMMAEYDLYVVKCKGSGWQQSQPSFWHSSRRAENYEDTQSPEYKSNMLLSC